MSTTYYLPPEPEVLLARLAVPDGRAAMQIAVAQSRPGPYDCGWYGTSVSRERPLFCAVQEGGALEDLLGDTLAVWHRGRSVPVYCWGAVPGLPNTIQLDRRAFMELELAALSPLNVRIDVLQ